MTPQRPNMPIMKPRVPSSVPRTSGGISGPGGANVDKLYRELSQDKAQQNQSQAQGPTNAVPKVTVKSPMQDKETPVMRQKNG